MYNESYRGDCVHKLPNGREFQQPEWKLDAIRRHLLFTTNESGNSTVFDNCARPFLYKPCIGLTPAQM